MIPASYPLVGPSLRLRDAGGYEPTLSPSIEFAGTLISQFLRHLASCDDDGGSIEGIQTYWGLYGERMDVYQQRKTRSSSLAAESNRIGFWGDKGRAGEYMLYILLYDDPLTIPCDGTLYRGSPTTSNPGREALGARCPAVIGIAIVLWSFLRD